MSNLVGSTISFDSKIFWPQRQTFAFNLKIVRQFSPKIGVNKNLQISCFSIGVPLNLWSLPTLVCPEIPRGTLSRPKRATESSECQREATGWSHTQHWRCMRRLSQVRTHFLYCVPCIHLNLSVNVSNILRGVENRTLIIFNRVSKTGSTNLLKLFQVWPKKNIWWLLCFWKVFLSREPQSPRKITLLRSFQTSHLCSTRNRRKLGWLQNWGSES